MENEEFVEYKLKPNYKFMGPKFGKDMKKIADYLDSLTPEETSQIVKKINFSDEYILNFSGKEFALKSEDIQISVNEKSGYVIETKGEMYLALDIHLSQDLINEGYAREIVNKIQFTRKENKFEIMDKINFIYFADDILKKVIDEHKDYIKTETLSENIILAEKQEDMQKWDINDQVIYFKLEKKQLKMKWQYVVLLASTIWAFVNIFDKYLIGTKVKNNTIVLFMTGIACLVYSLGIYFFCDLHCTDLKVILLCIANGIVTSISVNYYFKAVQCEDISKVIPLFYCIFCFYGYFSRYLFK